ncbi:spermatogenesis-associated protein 22-like [Sinocyclocheilus anshuiensis]|uniref:Spermatogenesis-associated protein 22-like n=1 Tax=Sinocyclocheilus anshuiensis TaxID=1608454 RepID=A0A671NYW4_9TELE|nr:PREDICTED: spermatogenesis-associated protein 22-like [Sinocyclocheilus anshuiensis]XP_016343956.1 PREDICTED: spermatogenesis-associated protein 22-like [Sinocyclocheilus anshuiensis]
MRRNANQRPTTGSLSVPLFNQRKRSRLPLMSNPSESELFTTSHYNETKTSSSSSALPTLGQSGQWNQRTYLSSQQASMRSAPSPGVVGRGYAPLPHPKKPAYVWSQTGQQRPPVRQDSMPAVGSQLNGGFPRSSSVSLSQPRWSSSIQNQQSFNRPTNSPRLPYSSQQCTPTAGSTQGPGAQSHSGKWNFRPVEQSASGMWAKEKMDTLSVRPTPQQQKPPRETSLHVITAVIEGMKHWSQYKSRVPMLFEMFATLDSAVTVGEHGAKKFLMRHGKEVVQCLYYENDQTLPRLIRGQVHRCVGNYDREKDIMTCVSVRAASLSEQKNALEAVRASDAEMRDVVLAFSEM